MDRIETISYDLKEEVFVVYLERNGTYGPPRTIRIKPSQLETAFDEAFQRAVVESQEK